MKEGKLPEERKKARQEMQDLIDNSKKNSVIQPNLFPLISDEGDDESLIFDSSIFSDTADPEKSYRLYYTMRSLLMQNLPQGKENAALRKIIYEQKNLFLNQGKAKNKNGVRFSDGRMSYISSILEPAFNLTTEWVKSGSNPMDIFDGFWKLNESYGFNSSE